MPAKRKRMDQDAALVPAADPSAPQPNDMPAPFPSTFPLEIMGLIIDQLLQQSAHPVVAKLARLNKGMYGLVIPKLYYRIKVNSFAELIDMLQSRFHVYYNFFSSRSSTRHSFSANLSVRSIKHLDLCVLNQNDLQTEHWQALSELRKVWKQNRMEPLALESIDVTTKSASAIDIVGLVITTSMVKARHVRWRQSQWDILLCRETGISPDGSPFSVMGVESATWRRSRDWVQAMETQWGDYFESYDLPLYTITTLTGARHTIHYQPNNFSSKWTPSWKNQAWLKAIRLSMDQAIAEDPDDPSFPTFLLFHFPQFWIFRIRQALASIFARPGMPVINEVMYFINDSTLKTGSHEEWTEWLKKDYWGDAKDNQMGAEVYEHEGPDVQYISGGVA